MSLTYIDRDAYIPSREIIFLLDPGHGGLINGKYVTAPAKMCDHGDFKFYEGVFNREIVKRLTKKMKSQKISYILSTSFNEDTSLPIRVIRGNNIERIYGNSVFVSIHSNADSTGTAKGIEVFTSPGDTPADPMATILYNHLSELGWKMRKDFSDGDPDKESKFYVLVHTIAPAILLELGFFTNREEAIQLLDPDVQDQICDKIVNGFIEIRNEKRNSDQPD